MKVSPTSSALTTRVLVGLLVIVICVFGASLRAMGQLMRYSLTDGLQTLSLVQAVRKQRELLYRIILMP